MRDKPSTSIEDILQSLSVAASAFMSQKIAIQKISKDIDHTTGL